MYQEWFEEYEKIGNKTFETKKLTKQEKSFLLNIFKNSNITNFNLSKSINTLIISDEYLNIVEIYLDYFNLKFNNIKEDNIYKFKVTKNEILEVE